MKNKREIFLKNNLFLIIGASILFIAYMYHFDKSNIIYHLGDEFGYWANAAFFYGHDWSGVASHNTYYSFGYSIILAPLFCISNFDIRYKVALFINIFMQIVSFLLLYGMAKKLFYTLNNKVIMLIAFCVSLYTSNTFFAKTTLSESFLYFAFVSITYLVVQLCEKKRWIYYILLGLLSAFVFAIHMRAISITISVIIFLILEFVLEPENRKKILLAFMEIVIMFFFLLIFKEHIVENLYASNETVAVNDFSGQVGKLNLLLSIDGIVLLIKSVVGKVYYLLSASFLILAWTGVWLFQKLSNTWHSIKRYNYLSIENKLSIYLFFSFLFTLGVSSIYMISESSVIDHLIYGRYNEYILGPLLILGGCFLFETKGISWRVQISMIGIYLVSSLLVTFTFRNIENPTIREVNIAGVAYLAYNNESCLYENWEIVITLKVIFISMIFFSLLWTRKQQIKIIAFVFVGALWLYGGNFVLDYQLCYRESYYTCKNISDYLIENDISEITYITNDSYPYFESLRPDILQFMNPELKITYKNIKNISLNEEKAFFVRRGYFEKDFFKNYSYIISSNDFDLYINNN